MKMKQFKEMNDAELANQLEEIRKERFSLRNQAKTGQLENPAKLKTLRRDTARILTEQMLRAAAKANA